MHLALFASDWNICIIGRPTVCGTCTRYAKKRAGRDESPRQGIHYVFTDESQGIIHYAAFKHHSHSGRQAPILVGDQLQTSVCTGTGARKQW